MFIGNFLIGSLKPAQQLGLVQAKKWKKLQIFCKKERLDIVAEDELFDNPEGLETLLADYVQRYSIREELQRKLQQKKLLSQIKIYCDNHNDFCFSEPSAYCAYLKDYGEAQNDYKVTKEAESILFETENHPLLLKMAADNRIFIHENKIRFLMLYRSYPKEIEKYQSQYGKNISWSGDEQFEVVKGHIRLIFRLEYVSLKTEALLFEPENESVLLEYASTRKFFHHVHEMRFLLMGQKYPTEVEQYLTKYGKNISLTDDEEFNVVERNKNALLHLKVQSLAVYRDYVLPEKRRKRIPFSEEDLPMLIRLSYDNPLLLEEFVIEHGKLSPEYEAELFFKAEEKCRKKYIELYGVNLRTLVKNAAQYGVTETEQQVLDAIDFTTLSIFTQLNNWKFFQIKKIKDMRGCELGKRVCGGCWRTELRCYQCSYLKSVLCMALPVLLNIARRNNLLGVG